MEGYYFSVKFGLLLILYTFIVELLPLSYWHIGFLDKKFAGFKKIFIPLSFNFMRKALQNLSTKTHKRMTKTETNNKLMDYIAPEFSPMGKTPACLYGF